jgi:hypothetical protein
MKCGSRALLPPSMWPPIRFDVPTLAGPRICDVIVITKERFGGLPIDPAEGDLVSLAPSSTLK